MSCRDVDAALASEAGVGRRGLHLVVMGHVDAGRPQAALGLTLTHGKQLPEH
jgi:hypothetical protein